MGENVFEEILQEGEDTSCQATTTTGNSCSNAATWPEDNPQYCHIHTPEEDEIEEGKLENSAAEKFEITDEVYSSRHIFSSDRSRHRIFVTYPDERSYFVAEFDKGAYETDCDEKAELLMEYIKNKPNLSRRIKKLK